MGIRRVASEAGIASLWPEVLLMWLPTISYAGSPISRLALHEAQ